MCKFDELVDQERDPIEGLRKMVDPRLGDNYSIDSINKLFMYHKHFVFIISASDMIYLSFSIGRGHSLDRLAQTGIRKNVQE